MSTKAVNRLFLVSLIVEVAVILFLGFTGIRLSGVASIVLTQLIVLVPALCFLWGTKTSPAFIAHKKMHPVTPVLCIVFAALSMPLITVVNMISMLFVENAANQLAYEMLNVPGWLIILLIGILGPANEEFICRGIYYHSYKKTGRLWGAMHLSAFLFGIMHMNFNQMSYAIVVGVLAVLLVEATGSIVSSFIFHASINTYNAVIMIMQKDTLAATGGDTGKILEESLAMLNMSYEQFWTIAIVMYSMIAIATTTIAFGILYLILRCEKRQNVLKTMFARNKSAETEKKPSLFSMPLVIGIVLSLAYMIIVR